MTNPDNNRHLTIPQLNAIDLILGGTTDQEVANVVGVTRQTICGWRNHDPFFRATLNARRAEIWGTAQDSLRALLPRAVERLSDELDGDNGGRLALRLVESMGLTDPHQPSFGPTEARTIVEADALAARPSLFEQPVTDDELARAIERLQARAQTPE